MRIGILYVGLFFALLCLAFGSAVYATPPCGYCYLGSTCDDMYGDTTCTLSNCYKCVAGSNRNKYCNPEHENDDLDCYHWFEPNLCGNVREAPCLGGACGSFFTTPTPCGGIFDCDYHQC